MGDKDIKVEEIELKGRYVWVESIHQERLHWIRVKLKQPGKVFDWQQPRGGQGLSLPAASISAK
jgi:hypothetical protein